MQVFAGKKIQAIAFPPRTDQAIGALPFCVTPRITLEGPEIGRGAVNDVRIGVL